MDYRKPQKSSLSSSSKQRREQNKTGPQALQPSDFYIDEKGNYVFTTSYHRKRGYCCNSGCRHCPY